MNDLMTQHEDVSSDASRAAASYITVALAAAQRLVDLRARAADRRAGSPAVAGADDLHPDRAAVAAMLGPDRGGDASSQSALQAWAVAQPHRDSNSDADLVAGRAEDRLRTLHPDAMARYDQLRETLDPVAAMRQVAPLILQEQRRRAVLPVPPVMLEDAAGATSAQALNSLSTAPPPRDRLPGAEAVTDRAEARLGELRPAAMASDDEHRTAATPKQAPAEHHQFADPASVTSAAHPPGLDDPTRMAERSAPDVAGRDTHQPLHLQLQPVVRSVLEPELASAVLADQRWPQLALALGQARDAGADPAVLLRDVAAERELTTAKSPAQVLQHRLDKRTADTVAPPEAASQPTAAQRTPTAADVAASSFPTALPDAPAHPRAAQATGPDLAVLGAVLELERDAATERSTARDAAIPDNPATVHVDERSDGATNAYRHQALAAAAQSRAAGMHPQPSAPAPLGAAGPAAAVASHSYPQPVAQATPAQPSPAATGTPLDSSRAAAQPAAAVRRR